ncbi:MBL fold metallo-hydrolase [Mariniluteicoccus flavus]
MIDHLLAPNPGAMTLEGTNTWILAPTGEAAVVIDPGPADPDHILAIRSLCSHGIREVWLTHHHHDHSESAQGLADSHGADVRAFDRALSSGKPFSDDERVRFGEFEVTVHHLPGHTRDSVGFVVSGGGVDDGPVLLTGDSVLGRGTTVIAHPDGDLAAYLASLQRMQRIVADRGVRRILPGHGPVIDDPRGVLSDYVQHRHDRLDQVRRAVRDGARSADDVVDAVYGDLSPTLRAAALKSAQAQLADLRDED